MERLRILAAAVALGEFTAGQLAAYSGASENTVRSVLRREARLFRATDSPADSPPDPPAGPEGRPNGRPPRRIRVVDRDAVVREISVLEREITELARAELSGVPPARDEVADRVAALTVALNSVGRAWAAADAGVRHTVCETALNTLRDIKPAAGDEQLAKRAAAVGTLARLTLAESAGEPIGARQLWSASRAATELLPELGRSARWAMFMGLSRLARAASQLPPVGMLTSQRSTPADAFAGVDTRRWTAHRSHWSNHRLWSQRWTESLFGHGLASCLVLFDEGDDDLLDAVGSMPGTGDFPTIVVSRRFDVSVVRKVTTSGAMFLPPDSGEADLSDAIMNNPFLHTVTASIDNFAAGRGPVHANTWRNLLASGVA